MNLKVRYVTKGDHKDEKVVIDVINDCDLTHYMLCDTTKTSENTISNKIRHRYWFNPQKVKSGDVIVLYTKEGTRSTRENENGTTHYFYYWNLKSNVWNNDGDVAVLIYTSAWKSFPVK